MNINSLPKSRGDKFKIINQTKIDVKIPKTKFNSDSENVIVYLVSNLDSYIRFAYLSIYYLIKNTDARDFDLRIVTDKILEKKVKKVFSPVIGDRVVAVDKAFKHESFNLFRDKKNICFIDADGFILSDEPTNIFERIFNDDAVLMKPTSFSVKHEYTNRSDYWKWRKEQKKLFNKEWIESKELWRLAGLSNYPTKYFDSGFYAYLQWASDQNIFDDEALLMSYFFSKGVTIHSIENHIKWFSGFEVFGYKGDPAFVHPLEGEAYYSNKIKLYIKKLAKG